MKLNDRKNYEEPKLRWYIGSSGVVHKEKTTLYSEPREIIGNSFETEEEAEKAVRKLKAWKRLKEKGFSFDGWNVKSAGSDGDHLLINMYAKDCTECEELLDLLFSDNFDEDIHALNKGEDDD